MNRHSLLALTALSLALGATCGRIDAARFATPASSRSITIPEAPTTLWLEEIFNEAAPVPTSQAIDDGDDTPEACELEVSEPPAFPRLSAREESHSCNATGS